MELGLSFICLPSKIPCAKNEELLLGVLEGEKRKLAHGPCLWVPVMYAPGVGQRRCSWSSQTTASGREGNVTVWLLPASLLGWFC